MTGFEYHRPGSLREASALLKELGSGARLLAGGTDVIPGIRLGKLTPEHLVSLRDVEGLSGVEFDGKTLTLGARCTLNELIAHEELSGHFPVLAEVLGTIASHQVRNRATIGGNLCNAAPSADSAPLLMCIGAKVKIYSDGGERELPLEDLFKGPGVTALAPGEILTHVIVDKPSPNVLSAYVKHKIRESLEIAITGVAVALTVPQGGSCEDARVVVAACAPTPLRARAAEKILTGSHVGDDDVRKAGEAAAAEVVPIDDVRGSAGYRREMTAVSLERAVRAALASRDGGERKAEVKP